MPLDLRGRATAALEKLSPRSRQFALAGVVLLVAFGLLWAIFVLSSGDKPARPAAASAKPGDLKPTNVDLMAPGAQFSEVDNWVGQAGRKVDKMASDLEDEKRRNRQRDDEREALLRRFAELEKRVTTPTPASSPAAMPMPAAPVPAASAVPPAPPAFPPEAALGREAGRPLPPPPTPSARARAAMPAGAPDLALLRGAEPPAQPQLVRVVVPSVRAADAPSDPASSAGRPARQGVETFLPVSFTRGQLLGGLDAPTGGQSQTNPHPVLIRLSDNSVLPNRFRGEYRDCFVIAAGYGDISSERAYLRTESLSCVREDGTALEVRIQGSVFGEDGKVGLRGQLVSKQGQMLANALLAGVVSGIGQGVALSSTTYGTSPLGSVATVGSGGNAFRAGIGTGVGKALDRLAQYYIKLAEQTFPVIEIDAGREVDVVITKGVRIEGAETAAAAQVGPSGEPRRRTETSERFTRTLDDDE